MRGMIDLRDFACSVERIVTRHNLNRPGRYARWLRQDDSRSRDLGINPYGCADAANILLSLDPNTDDGLNDLHQLFGAVCAVAELQQALPGLLRTDRPLRLVLDRRPSI
jgi:hypothetical protein